MNKFSYKIILLLSLLLAFVVIPHSAAQQEDQEATCEALLDQVLVRVERVCEGVGRNEACYGNERVDARFTEGNAYAFSQPADRVPLMDLSSLVTYPLDVRNNLWGVAMMNVQANLPDTFAGQGVLFVLYGDVQLENQGRAQRDDVPFLDALVEAAGPVNMRSGPGYDYNVIDLAMPGAEVVLEGRSEDGQWVLANVDSISAWIATQFVTMRESSVDALAVRHPSAAYGPMQAFYLTTGVGQPECRNVPSSSLVIQSPDGYVINLNVNGVNVNVASTISLRTTEDTMTVTTLEGGASMAVGSFSAVVPAGFSAQVPLRRDNSGSLRPAGPPQPPQLLDAETYAPLEEAGTPILEQPVVVPVAPETTLEDFCADPENAALCANPGIVEPASVCGDNICSTNEYCPSDCNGTNTSTGSGSATCGDNFCDPIFLGETAANCPNDCGGTVSICGDFVCDAAVGEDATSCAFDCVPHSEGPLCGDNTCDLAGGESSESCPADCSTNLGSNLGVPINGGISDGGATIGSGRRTDPTVTPGVTEEPQPSEAAPNPGSTAEATPEESGTAEITPEATSRPAAQCGDGICVPGEVCPADCDAGTEEPEEISQPQSYCGDLICGIGEDSSICPADCGTSSAETEDPFGSSDTSGNVSEPQGYCGDLICGIGEDSSICPADCGAPSNPPPDEQSPPGGTSPGGTEESASGFNFDSAAPSGAAGGGADGGAGQTEEPDQPPSDTGETSQQDAGLPTNREDEATTEP